MLQEILGAGSLGTLFVQLTADSSKLVRGMHEAERTMSSSFNRMVKQAAVLGAAVSGALGVVGTIALREFIAFESSFAGVRKTVNATEEEFKKLSESFRQMARQLPVSVNEINKIAESAGQLGIKTENLETFTRTMIDLGNTTNLAGDVAATQLARLANITQMSQKEFSRLGSSIVALGNNLATTEAEIVDMAMRLAGAGTQVGMTEAEIVGFSAALSSVGIQAEAGGTAMSQAMILIAKAVQTGSAELETFAQIAGQSSTDFVKAYQENATQAILQFIGGLKKISDQGGDVFTLLENLGMDGIRLTDVMLRASGAGDLFNRSLRLSSQAWKENTALAEEARKRYETIASQLMITKNLFTDILITIGEGLAPSLVKMNDALKDMVTIGTSANTTLKETSQWLGESLIVALKMAAGALGFIRDVLKLVLIELLRVAGWSVKLGILLTDVFTSLGSTIVKALLPALNFVVKQINKVIAALPKAISDTLGLAPMSEVAEDFLAPFANTVKETMEDTYQLIELTREELKNSLAGTAGEAAQDIEQSNEVIQKSFEDTGKGAQKAAEDAGAALRNMAEQSQKTAHMLDLIGLPPGASRFANETPEARQARLKQMTSDAVRSMKIGEGGKVEDAQAAEMLRQAGLDGGSGLDLTSDMASAQTKAIQNEIQLNRDKLQILKELGEMEVNQTQEFQDRKAAAIEAYNDRLKQLQMAQADVLVGAWEGAFSDMAEAMRGAAGEQSAVYKTMFAASKAFAIADSIIKIQQAIAQAWGDPSSTTIWQKMAAVAAVTSATANIISSITAVELAFGGGRAEGGPVSPSRAYLVGEEGPELFVPTARGNIVPNDQLGGREPVKVVVNNYTEARPVVTERQEGGGRIIDITIQRIKDDLASEIREGRGSVSRAMETTFALRRGHV